MNKQSEREDEDKLCIHGNRSIECNTCLENDQSLKCPKCDATDTVVDQTFNIPLMRTVSWQRCNQCQHEWNYQ